MSSKQIAILVFTTALLAAGISAFVSALVHSNTDKQPFSQNQISDRLERLEIKLDQEYEVRVALEKILNSARLAKLEEEEDFSENNEEVNQRFDADTLATEFVEDELQDTSSVDSVPSREKLPKIALIDTGLSEDEATYILKIEADLALEQLNRRYQNQRAAFERTDPEVQSSLGQTNPLRAKLGDEYYENYLKANGFPTAARVSSVIESSAGYNAGLQSGDRITSYGGQRVFNLNDVANLTFRGAPGESVLLEIERNGEALQLTIPRGPIGASSGRRRSRP